MGIGEEAMVGGVGGGERGNRMGRADGECNDAPRMNMHDKRDRVSLRKRLKQFRAPELRSFVRHGNRQRDSGD